MAPMLLEQRPSRSFPTTPFCSDPLVVPSTKASKRIKDMWWLHGHPHSKRYSNPKLVSLAALVRYDGTFYNSQEAFLYPASAEHNTPYHSMSWDRFDSVTESIALIYAYQLEKELRSSNITQVQPTVALLGSGSTIEYFCTQLALQKLGLRVLLLAESNAKNAIHCLLDSCDVLVVITDLKNAKADVNGVRKIRMIESLPSDTHTGYCEVDAVKFKDIGDIWERHTFIIHSSGSTGMPKPIMHTNRSMMSIARMYRLFQEFNIENWFLLFPLYHIAGISIALSGLPNGQLLSFPPLTWPLIPTRAIFTAWETLSSMGHPVDCVHCAPTLIENMYEYILASGSDFTPLSSLKVLEPGGAVLSAIIIQDLTEHGVNVKTTYGSTEIGPPFRSIPHTRSNPKCYSFRNLYPDDPFIKMDQVGEGLYECVVYKGFSLAAELWPESSDNEPYRTNDLFIQDPPGSGFYVMQGRKDDILVHTNGENTNAGSLQIEIQNASAIIHKALVLGHSKPCVSLLVEVYEIYNSHSATIKEKVWKTVEGININYPAHSQIVPSMIYILPNGKFLPTTPKGNVKRKEGERIFSDEINDLYSTSTSLTSLTPTTTPQEPLSTYIRTLLSALSDTPAPNISDWTSLYDLGLDSRAALALRSALIIRLNRPVSLSFIFEHPTIQSLLSVLEPGPISKTSDVKGPPIQVIETIISRLEREFDSWPLLGVRYPQPESETILLTGATGTLGSSLLLELLASPDTTHIYVLIRSSSPLTRLSTAVTNRQLPATRLLTPKITILEYRMQDPLLGLEVQTYTKLAAEVTTVVHGAWKMDFNAGVEGFEGCFRGLQYLLRFCHGGRPKRIVFTSSIASCLSRSSSSSTSTATCAIPIPESPPAPTPSSCLAMGYAQSKYISERILQTASSHPNLQIPVILLRVGQLCGHSSTRIWSSTEWFPILLSTSLSPNMRALPTRSNALVDWVPVDVAAKCITELILTPSPSPLDPLYPSRYEVFNITNPSPISWDEMLDMLQQTLASQGHSSLPPSSSSNQPPVPQLPLPLPQIPLSEWVTRLSTLPATETADIPALKLLPFFEDMALETEEARVFSTGKAVSKSKALRECKAFGKDDLMGLVGDGLVRGGEVDSYGLEG